MYGKIDENGKFVAAPTTKNTINETNRTIIEYYTSDELEEMGYKEVYTADGVGRRAPGLRPMFTYEDKGNFILRRMNWVDVVADEQAAG